jgi:GT2 family glycosyltransferase
MWNSFEPGRVKLKPAISVVIPNYNGVKHLEGCLRALRAQTFRSFETILVDNGSTDSSIDFVRANFPELRIVALSENRGFTGGTNAGVAIARGELIAFLNNDTEADPVWLEALYRARRANPEFDMFASCLVLFDRPELLDSAGDGFTNAAAPFKRGHLEPARNYNSNQEVFSPSGAAACFKRAVIDEIGSLDEDFFLVHEDVDLGFRARLRGYRCLYVADAVVKHRVNSSIGYMTRDYVFYGHRNLEYVFWKDLPLSLLLRCLPAHCAFNLLAFGHFLTHGRGLTFIHAKLAAIVNLPKVLRKRSAVQAGRSVAGDALLSQMEKKWFTTKLRNATRRSPNNKASDIGSRTEEAEVV